MPFLTLSLTWLLCTTTTIIPPTQAINWWMPKGPPGYGLPPDPKVFLEDPQLLPRSMADLLDEKRDSWCRDCIRYCMDPNVVLGPRSFLGRMLAEGNIKPRTAGSHSRLECIDLCSNDAANLAQIQVDMIRREVPKYRLKRTDPRFRYLDTELAKWHDAAKNYRCYDRHAPPAETTRKGAAATASGTAGADRGRRAGEKTSQRQQQRQQQWNVERPPLKRPEVESQGLQERVGRVFPGVLGVGAAAWRLLNKGLFR